MNVDLELFDQVHNPGGIKRVLVTKNLPGDRWLQYLIHSGCRVEICAKSEDILSIETISKLIGSECHGVIGQLTEVISFSSKSFCMMLQKWGDELFSALKAAGGTAYSNYAVGYNNVDVPAATKNGISMGNTPGTSSDLHSITKRLFRRLNGDDSGTGISVDIRRRTTCR